MPLRSKHVDSPVGRLRLVASEHGLVAVLWDCEPPQRVDLGEPSEEDAGHLLLNAAQGQLAEYFAGTRTAFTMPLDMRGSPFQKRVWACLLEIPFGATATYGALARKLGDPRLTRAVGAANGRNPLSIVVPCHRVVGAGGRLTGFAGGLEAKAKLLALEQQFGFRLR